jgi:hypothetical protein
MKKDNTILWVLGAYAVWYFFLKNKTNTASDQVIKSPVMPIVQAPATPFDPLFGSPMTTSVNSTEANYTAKFVLNGYRTLGKMPNTI